jgi:hypothetical protein
MAKAYSLASWSERFKKHNRADVTVLGRPEEGSPASQGDWIEDHPDHGCLSVEVQKVGS